VATPPTSPMAAPTPSRAAIHVEVESAGRDFHQLLEQSTPAGLAGRSNGTRWTNRQLLFHMLFGYLITRNLRIVVKIVTRAPLPVSAALRGYSTRPPARFITSTTSAPAREPGS